MLLLWSEAAERGYSSNLWLTYKQAETMGVQFRKGEKYVMCVFFEKIKKEADDGQEETFYPMAKPLWLFNAAQIDGLPETLTAPAATQGFLWRVAHNTRRKPVQGEALEATSAPAD